MILSCSPEPCGCRPRRESKAQERGWDAHEYRGGGAKPDVRGFRSIAEQGGLPVWSFDGDGEVGSEAAVSSELVKEPLLKLGRCVSEDAGLPSELRGDGETGGPAFARQEGPAKCDHRDEEILRRTENRQDRAVQSDGADRDGIAGELEDASSPGGKTRAE